MEISVRYSRRLQIADYEPIEYGVSVSETSKDGESDVHLAARTQAFAGDLFNQIEAAVLDDHDSIERAVPLSTMEAEDDDPKRSSPPRRRK